MIPLAHLRRSVTDALAYLHMIDDIEEAEVFASSNGQLLTRLNYTSHIPCNGVEEPKSTESYGIGIQAVLKTAEGRKIGFGSESSDISLEGVKEALVKARIGAVLDPEFQSLARPTSERRTLRRYHDPQLMRLADGDLVGAGWQVLGGALRTFETSEALSDLAGPTRSDSARRSGKSLRDLGLIVGGDVTILQERIAVASYAMPQPQTDESALILSFITAMVEREGSKGSGYAAATRLAEFGDGAGRQAARNAIDSMGGVRVKTGEYRVVFGQQAVMDLMVNLVMPSLNLGTFYAGASPFLGKLGQPVAAEMLSVYDDGAAPGLAGSKGITCEGLPTGRTDLIVNGALKGLLANYYESQRILVDPRAKEKLGVDPSEQRAAFVPRNGFRFTSGGGRHHGSQPGIFATNVIIQGNDRSREELLRDVGDGLYLGRIWYTYPVNGLRAGDFTCTVVGDSYVIRDGRLAEPIKANSIRLNDSIHDVLRGIIGVGRERHPTLVWAADEIVYAPDVAVAKVRVEEIAGYTESL
ncbi:MAG TPA: metallopeptidase TldD-related protein [Dehalococcoidia bacterium]|nr:metallopeptidase TldD-related protein [Dehalococcoidia bacterium]